MNVDEKKKRGKGITRLLLGFLALPPLLFIFVSLTLFLDDLLSLLYPRSYPEDRTPIVWIAPNRDEALQKHDPAYVLDYHLKLRRVIGASHEIHQAIFYIFNHLLQDTKIAPEYLFTVAATCRSTFDAYRAFGQLDPPRTTLWRIQHEETLTQLRRFERVLVLLCDGFERGELPAKESIDAHAREIGAISNQLRYRFLHLYETSKAPG